MATVIMDRRNGQKICSDSECLSVQGGYSGGVLLQPGCAVETNYFKTCSTIFRSLGSIPVRRTYAAKPSMLNSAGSLYLIRVQAFALIPWVRKHAEFSGSLVAFG